MSTQKPGTRNFNTISPSAQTLLLMKGHTNIPFARQAAALIAAPEKYEPNYADKDLAFLARTLHFEQRYYAIDQLLQDLSLGNMLELSSGFSFRGLALAQNKNVHYIDTDLPPLIAQKTNLLKELQGALPTPKGRLETVPLNALNKEDFAAVVSHFNDGPVTIVNEGLLMYLNTEEKEKLCSIIHEMLKKRGGYWITADIYVKQPASSPTLRLDDELQQFLDKHNIEDNKFTNLEAAENFFADAGFFIDEVAVPDYSILSALPFLQQKIQQKDAEKMKQMGTVNAVWRLKVA